MSTKQNVKKQNDKMTKVKMSKEKMMKEKLLKEIIILSTLFDPILTAPAGDSCPPQVWLRLG
jgi:hypothetical protein